MLYVPRATRHLSLATKRIFTFCRQEPLIKRNTDCMRLFLEDMTVVQFIDKWIATFSERVQDRLIKIRNSTRNAFKVLIAILFLVKLKRKSGILAAAQLFQIQPKYKKIKKTPRVEFDSSLHKFQSSLRK